MRRIHLFLSVLLLTLLSASLSADDFSITRIFIIFHNIDPSLVNDPGNGTLRMSIETCYTGEVLSSDDIQYYQMLYYPKATPYLELGTDGFRSSAEYLGSNAVFACKHHPNSGNSITTKDIMIRIKRKNDILPTKIRFSIGASENFSVLYNQDFAGTITPSHQAVPLRPVAISAQNTLNTFIIRFSSKGSSVYSGKVLFYDSEKKEIASAFQPLVHPISREPARYLNDGAGLYNGDEINTIRLYPSELAFSETDKSLSDIASARIVLESDIAILSDHPEIRYSFRAISNEILITSEESQQ